MKPKSETLVFCHKHKACPEGFHFASSYVTMEDCYEALLGGCAGKQSAEWAVWVYTRDGVVSAKKRCDLAAFCVEHIKQYIKDNPNGVTSDFVGWYGICLRLLSALKENKADKRDVFTISYVTANLVWDEDNGYAKWQLDYLDKQKNPFRKRKETK